MMREWGDGPEAIACATEVVSERIRSSRIQVGKLISTGRAPDKDKADEKNSRYVVVEDDAGTRAKSGMSIRRALQESMATLGEEVILSFRGRKRIEIDVAIHDGNDKVTGHEK